MTSVQNTLKTLAKIEPDEIRTTLLSFGFVFTLMASYYILRPIRDAMSSDWTDAELSTLFTATFLFSVIAVVVYGAVCARLSFRRLVPAVYAFFALSFLTVYGLQTSWPGEPLVGKAFYVWVSVFSLFQMSVFWSFMAEIFTKAQAPRLFGFIAAGASIGAVVGPGLAVILVDKIGTDNLLLLAALLLLVGAVVSVALQSAAKQEGDSANAQPIGGNPFAGFTLFARDPYLLGVGVFILLYTAISTLVYFELKNLLAGVDGSVRVQIWGGMDLAVNVLAIGTAMFATGRIASRFGLVVTLPLIPVTIVGGLLLVAIAPMLWVVVGLQVFRRAGNYAITRPGREMLFTRVDRETRFKAKSVIDVVIYRGGDMLTAWAFTGLTQGLGLGLAAIAAIGAAIAALWGITGAYLGRVYDRDTKNSY